MRSSKAKGVRSLAKRALKPILFVFLKTRPTSKMTISMMISIQYKKEADNAGKDTSSTS